ELVALEQGLEAVRASASAADQRNQETLQAVHETLEQIVNKIAELESANFAAPAQPAWHDAQGAPAWQDRAPAASESYQQPQRPAGDPFAYVPSPIAVPAAHSIQPQEAAAAPPFPEASQPAGPPGSDPGCGVQRL